MRIRFHRNFEKAYQKLRKREQQKAQKRLTLFLENPYDPMLNNHPLKGKYLDYRSINITGDLRAIYKFKGDDESIFVALDTHSKLYS